MSEQEIPVRDKYPSKACYLKLTGVVSEQIKAGTLPEQFQKFFTYGEGANVVDAEDGGIMSKTWLKALVPNEANTDIDNQDVQDFADFAVYCDGQGEPLQTIIAEEAASQKKT